MQPNEILLVTSALEPGRVPQLKIRDPKERLWETLCGLLSWFECPSVQTIVFCDSTAPSYDFSRIVAEAARHGKELEVLTFDGIRLAEERGKGYAEGELLHHALEHSKHLRGDVPFYKISGRIFVENYEEIRAAHAADRVVFQVPAWGKWTPNSSRSPFATLRLIQQILVRMWYTKSLHLRSYNRSVDTRFFKCDTAFFRKHLRHAHERADDWHYYQIEQAYFDELPAGSYAPFRTACVLVGQSATLGTALVKPYNAEKREAAARFL